MSIATKPPGPDEPSPEPAGQLRRGGLASVTPGFARRLLGPIRDAKGLGKWMLWVGAALTLFFLVAAVFAPWIAPYDLNQHSVNGEGFAKYAPPSAQHWFGTNVQRFDILSRTIFGARTAVEVVLLAITFSLAIGVPLGLVSGYIGGWLDRTLVLVTDALFAFPYLLLAIVVAFLLSGSVGRGVLTAALAITVVYIPQYFRVVRNNTLAAREATYVEAARALGAKPHSVIGRYIFGNVVQSVPVIATLNGADAILTLAGLGFLGYGVQPSQAAEWGYDLQRAIPAVAAGNWWPALFPGLAIVLFVVALTLVGEGLNDTLNPTLRRRKIAKVRMPEEEASA